MSVESLGAFLALLFLVLAILERRECWLVCIASCAVYGAVFLDAKLYVDSALQLFYAAGAMYGWKMWHKGGQKLPIITWSARTHFALISIVWIPGLLLGEYLARTTDAAYPMLDAQLALFSILATWLQARKLLESWGYWVVIDLFYIALYLKKELGVTALLFGFYVLLAMIGGIRWYRERRGTGQDSNFPI